MGPHTSTDVDTNPSLKKKIIRMDICKFLSCPLLSSPGLNYVPELFDKTPTSGYPKSLGVDQRVGS